MQGLPDEGDTSSLEDEAIFAKMYEQSASMDNVVGEPENPSNVNNYATTIEENTSEESPMLQDEIVFAKMYEQGSSVNEPYKPSSNSSLLEAETAFAKMYEQKSNSETKMNPPPNGNNRTMASASYDEDTDSSLQDEAIFAKMYEQNSSTTSLLKNEHKKPPSIGNSSRGADMMAMSNSSLLEAEATFAKMYEQKSSESSLNAPSNANNRIAVTASVDEDTDSSLQDEEIFAKMYEKKSYRDSLAGQLKPPPFENKSAAVTAPVDDDTDSSLRDEEIFAKMYEKKSYRDSLAGQLKPPPFENMRAAAAASVDEDTESSLQDAAIFAKMYEQKSSETSLNGKLKPSSKGNMGTEMAASSEKDNDSSLQDAATFAKMYEQNSSQTSLHEPPKPSSQGSRRVAGVKSALSIPPKPPLDDSDSSLITSDPLHREAAKRRMPEDVPDSARFFSSGSDDVIEEIPPPPKNKFSTGGFTFGALSPVFKHKKKIKMGKFPHLRRAHHNDQNDPSSQHDPHHGDPRQHQQPSKGGIRRGSVTMGAVSAQKAQPLTHRRGSMNGAMGQSNNVREVPAFGQRPQRGLAYQESELALNASQRQKKRGVRRGSLLALGGFGKHKNKKDTDLPPTQEELEMMKEYEKKHGLDQQSSEYLVSPRQHTRKQSNRRGSMFGAIPQKQQAPAPPLASPVRSRKQSNRRGSMFGAMTQKQQAPPPPFASPVRKQGRNRRLSMFGNVPQSTHVALPDIHTVRQQNSDRELQASPLMSAPQNSRRNRRGSVFDVLGGHKQKKDVDLPPTQEEIEMMKEYEKKHGTNMNTSFSHLDSQSMELMSPPQAMRNRVRRGSVTTGLFQAMRSPMGMSKKKVQLDYYDKPSSARSLVSPYSSPIRKPVARRGSIQAGLPGGPPLPGQIDRRAIMQRIDSVGSIDFSLSSESVESGEMFAVPKKYDDELQEDIESSYRGINEFRGGSMEKRHAAVGLNMQIHVEEEEDPALLGYRNTMLKHGRQKALLSIEDLAKNDDELFDFLNEVAKEDGEMQWMKQTLEGNIYSLVYTAKWRSAAFWGALFVACVQVSMPSLAMFDLIDFQNPANPFQAPNNVSLQVRAMGVMALLLAVAQYWIFMAAVEKLLKGPPPRWEDTPPGATKAKFYVAYLMQATMGSTFIITIFTLVAQSTNVVSMFLNFAALEFITSVDKILFDLAKRGYFTNKIKRACDDVTNVLVIRRKGGRTVRRFVLASAASTITVLYFQIVFQQQTGAFDCGSLEIQFGDGFNTVLPLFSGIYTYDSSYRDGRPVYWDKRRRAAFRYCGNSEGALFSFEEGGYYVFNYISEDSGISSVDDMCNNYILRSPETKGFNILDQPTNTWVTKRRLTDSIQYSVDYFSLRCADCDPNTCNGECQEGVCMCLEGQYGPNCQFTGQPCEKMDIDGRTKRFQKAGSVFSSEFSILRKSNGLPALSYGRPIYTDSWSDRSLTDRLVIMNFGRRYFLFRMSFFNQINATALGDYLQEVHPYFDWLQYEYVLDKPILVSNVLQDGPPDAVKVFRPDFGSDPIDLGTAYDSITPLDLSWSRVDTSILNSMSYYDFLKRTSSVDTVLICSSCSDSSPCFGTSKCNTQQGTCDCEFTLAGRLCEVDCLDDPASQVCSDCFRDPSGEGCLQCHKDLNAPDCPWVLESLEPIDTIITDDTTNTTFTNTTAANSTIDDKGKDVMPGRDVVGDISNRRKRQWFPRQ